MGVVTLGSRTIERIYKYLAEATASAGTDFEDSLQHLYSARATSKNISIQYLPVEKTLPNRDFVASFWRSDCIEKVMLEPSIFSHNLSFLVKRRQTLLIYTRYPLRGIHCVDLNPKQSAALLARPSAHLIGKRRSS